MMLTGLSSAASLSWWMWMKTKMGSKFTLPFPGDKEALS